jgi:hypothetical protein
MLCCVELSWVSQQPRQHCCVLFCCIQQGVQRSPYVAWHVKAPTVVSLQDSPACESARAACALPVPAYVSTYCGAQSSPLSCAAVVAIFEPRVVCLQLAALLLYDPCLGLTCGCSTCMLVPSRTVVEHSDAFPMRDDASPVSARWCSLLQSLKLCC